MIHQLIFAAPKPGLTETEFQRYWLDVHAPNYASKIPQIRKYLIDTRVEFRDEEIKPRWSGVAEIWLANEEEQLASLQTEEFLLGARADEPNWAAFWMTVVLDTDAHEVASGPEGAGGIKLITLVKRREGLTLADFRAKDLSDQAELTASLPGLRRAVHGHTRDGAYGVGEAVLDAAHQYWFDDEASLAAALDSPEFKQLDADLRELIEPRYLHRLVVRENWVIGPQPR